MHSLLNMCLTHRENQTDTESPASVLTLFMVVKLYGNTDFMESITERSISYRDSLQTVIEPRVACVRGDVLTDLLVMLLGFQADDLEDAGAGDVRHHIGYTLPHTQQSATQHVVLTETHALQTLLAFLDFLTLPVPKERTEEPIRLTHTHTKKRHGWDRILKQFSCRLVAHERLAGYFFVTSSQVTCKSLGMASDLKTTLTES